MNPSDHRELALNLHSAAGVLIFALSHLEELSAFVDAFLFCFGKQMLNKF